LISRGLEKSQKREKLRFIRVVHEKRKKMTRGNLALVLLGVWSHHKEDTHKKVNNEKP